MGMIAMKSKFFQKFLIPVVKYAIAILAGYLTGDGSFTGLFQLVVCWYAFG